MSDGYGLEKRHFYRLSTPLEATVTLWTCANVPRSIPPLHLQCRNISRQGICLETESLEVSGISLLEGSPCARDNRLHLSLTLGPGEPDFTAVGEVRWYDVLRRAGTSLYQLGIEFVEMNEEDKKRLIQFLRQHEPPGLLERLLHRTLP